MVLLIACFKYTDPDFILHCHEATFDDTNMETKAELKIPKSDYTLWL
jgi:hypothetical protein